MARASGMQQYNFDNITFFLNSIDLLAQGLQSEPCPELTPEQRDKLVVLETSKPYVNQGVTVNARIPAAKRKLIIESLTKGEGRIAARPLFDRFSAKATRFVVADAKEYNELNLLKKNNMFGW